MSKVCKNIPNELDTFAKMLTVINAAIETVPGPLLSLYGDIAIWVFVAYKLKSRDSHSDLER